MKSIKCLHIYSLSLEKSVFDVKVISNTNNQSALLEEIYDKLNKYEPFHINVEIQKVDQNIGFCVGENIY